MKIIKRFGTDRQLLRTNQKDLYKEIDRYQKSLREYLLSILSSTHIPESVRTKQSYKTICEDCVGMIDLAHAVILSLWWIINPFFLTQKTFCQPNRTRYCWACKRRYPYGEIDRKQVWLRRNCMPIRSWRYQVEKNKESRKLKVCSCCLVICESDPVHFDASQIQGEDNKRRFVWLVLCDKTNSLSMWLDSLCSLLPELYEMIRLHNLHYEGYHPNLLRAMMGEEPAFLEWD